jgi:hypothetical protein
VKTKLSVTLDETLVGFIDAEPGDTRSEKLESIVRRYRQVKKDSLLREQLAHFNADDDDAEAEAWRRTMEEAQWNESDAATFGPSRSQRSRSRGRR